MNIVLTTSLVLCVLLFVIGVYLLYRNSKVYRFRVEIINSSYNVLKEFLASIKDDEEFLSKREEYLKLEKMSEIILDTSYEKMLLSIKPLKLEYWFNEEEINFIRKGLGKSNIKL